MKDKIPTADEIFRARKQISDQNLDRYPAVEVMKCWDGSGWHHSEILYGILVGLQIAENRECNPPVEGSQKKPAARLGREKGVVIKSVPRLRFDKYPKRTCYTLHHCQLCGVGIKYGDEYYDGGYNRRAHVACEENRQKREALDA